MWLEPLYLRDSYPCISVTTVPVWGFFWGLFCRKLCVFPQSVTAVPVWFALIWGFRAEVWPQSLYIEQLRTKNQWNSELQNHCVTAVPVFTWPEPLYLLKTYAQAPELYLTIYSRAFKVVWLVEAGEGDYQSLARIPLVLAVKNRPR